jgi:two-component system, OmpR family, sensor kinase
MTAQDRRTANWAARAWRAARGVSARTSLRTKLVATLLVLVLIALVTMGLAGRTLLRGQLLGTTVSDMNGEAASQNLYSCVQTGYRCPGGLDVYGYAGGQLQKVSFGIVSYPSGDQITPTLSDATLTWLAANTGHWTVVPVASGSGQMLVMGVPDQNQNATIILAADVTNTYITLRQLAGVDVIVSVIVLLVLAVIGFAVVQANLRPLVEIEETAEEIADGHLNRRVPERDPRTEIGSLGRSLNTMLAQIESAFHDREESEAAAHQSEERMRRFIADASHELRTPLTAIRGFAEYYRQRGGLVQQWDDDEPQYVGAQSGLTADDLDRIMHRVETEAARMGLLVEDLLLLARMDQQRPLAHSPVDLLSLAADAVHDSRMLAPDRTIELSVQPGAAFLVIGDEPRLRQVIGNLMSNALTHTPDGTSIEVAISSGVLDPQAAKPTPAVFLDVSDNGPGMTTEQADRVFERFYRADQARGRATGGSGLGLAIVASLVAAHGGVASLRTAPGEGATFRVALPLAPEAQDWDDGSAADDDLAAHDDLTAHDGLAADEGPSPDEYRFPAEDVPKETFPQGRHSRSAPYR